MSCGPLVTGCTYAFGPTVGELRRTTMLFFVVGCVCGAPGFLLLAVILLDKIKDLVLRMLGCGGGEKYSSPSSSSGGGGGGGGGNL